MKRFLAAHPIVTLLIVWALGDVVTNCYANKCKLEAIKLEKGVKT